MTARPDTSSGGSDAGSDRVRTYSARRGRLSALTLDRLTRLMPARALPLGRVDTHTLFGRSAPLVLDVGCGHGAAAIAYASTHPGTDVLAVDVHTPGIARLLAAADVAGVPNLRVELGDAVALLATRIPIASLAAVHLFFPDPWPKRSHVKRRFVSPDTLDLLSSRLRSGGYVLLATDQPAYASHVQSVVLDHGAFTVREVDRPPWRPVDGFERKALAAGRSVIDLRLDLAPGPPAR